MVEAAASRARRSEDTEIMRGLWKTFVRKREGGSLKVRYHAGQWLSDQYCGARWPTTAQHPVGHCPCVGYFVMLAAATIDKIRRKQAEQPWWSPDSLVAYACAMVEKVELDLYRERRVRRGAIARTDDQFTRGKTLYGGLDGEMEKSILVVYAALAGRLEYFPGWPIVDRHALSEVARDLGEPEDFLRPRFPEKRAIVRDHANAVSPRNRLRCDHGSLLPWWDGRVVHPLEEHATRPTPFGRTDGDPEDVERISEDDVRAAVYGEPAPSLPAGDGAHAEEVRAMITEVRGRLPDPADASRAEIRDALQAAVDDGAVAGWLGAAVLGDEGRLEVLVDSMREQRVGGDGS